MVSLQKRKDRAKMFELTYKDSYHVERTLKYEDYEALMLACLLYTSDAADDGESVDLGGRRIIKKKKKK